MLEMIRVLIVHEIPLMCDVVASVLEDQPDIVISGTASDLDNARKRARECDVVLISGRLLKRAALKLTESVRSESPRTKILMLGLVERKWEILPFIEAGASGYVLHDSSVEDLLGAIRAANNGQACVSPKIAGALVSHVAQLSEKRAQTTGWRGFDALTPREWQVLDLIRQGYSTKEIAERLVIELGTAKNHIHSVLRKLDVNTRQEAALCASAWRCTDRATDLLD